MMQKIYSWVKDRSQKGQSVIEYGLLIAVIVGAIALVTTDSGIGTAFNNVFGHTAKSVNDTTTKNIGTGTIPSS